MFRSRWGYSFPPTTCASAQLISRSEPSSSGRSGLGFVLFPYKTLRPGLARIRRRSLSGLSKCAGLLIRYLVSVSLFVFSDSTNAGPITYALAVSSLTV
uniref:Uncharacterized protein n=1 Tax=Picea glauca TaxID=3330 RepID=A0A117NIG7_PICGL|nr:hypothetical protein ABT39_MTgene3109 [Picea glauca]QHR86475.1 hypothetical protein Q903MT_gene475 [Picea sitchensis]